MAEKLTIPILEEIGGWGFSLNTLVDSLRGFQGKEIEVPINSYGGSAFDAIAIYNTLKGRSEKVTTKVVGYAMSAGTIILLGGDRVEMPRNGYFMIHNPWNMVAGDADDMDKNSALLKKLTNDLAKIYKKKTGLPLDDIKSMMKEETWLNGTEAKRLGFVDHLTDGVDYQASFDPKQIIDIKNYKNMPAEVKNQLAVSTDTETVEEVKTEEVVNEVVETEPVEETTTETVETTVDAVEETAKQVVGDLETTNTDTVESKKEEEVTEVKSDVDEVAQKLDIVLNKHQEILYNIAERKETKNASTEMLNAFNDAKNELTTVSARIAAIEIEKSNLSKEVENKTTEIKNLNTSIDEFKNEILAQDKKIEDLEAANKKLAKGTIVTPKEVTNRVDEDAVTGNSAPLNPAQAWQKRAKKFTQPSEN